MKLLVISYPFGSLLGGASKREFFVIREFLKLQNDISLYIPFRYIAEIFFLFGKDERKIEDSINALKVLEKEGLKIHPYFFELLENYKLRELFQNISKNTTKKLNYFVNQLEFEKLIFKKLSDEYSKENYDLIYTPQELVEFLFPTFLFSKKLNRKVVFLFHEPPFKRIYHAYRFLKISPINTILTLNYDETNRNILSSMSKRKLISKILAISLAPFILSGVNNLANKYGISYKVIKPANAFEKELLKYRKFKKEDYIIFFARLVPEKGIYEIPLLMKKLKESYDKNVKMVICGKFPNEKIKNNFLKLAIKYKVEDNIELKGFVKENELYELVSKAKVLVYPSHQDGFSLVVLESLALGTSVVAYNIPAIVSVYRNLKPVKIVKENDIKSMTTEIVKILKMDDKEYLFEHEDEKIKEFLSLHSSWKNVAKSELKELKTS